MAQAMGVQVPPSAPPLKPESPGPCRPGLSGLAVSLNKAAGAEIHSTAAKKSAAGWPSRTESQERKYFIAYLNRLVSQTGKL